MGRPVDARNIASELERRACEARVDLAGLRRDLASVVAQADRRSAELETLDASGPTLARRLAVCTAFFLLLLPLALFLGAAS